MKPMKFKKKTDEANNLCYDEIIIFDKQLDKVLHHNDLQNGCNEQTYSGDVYYYSLLAILDGVFGTISEFDWEAIEYCYEYVKE